MIRLGWVWEVGRWAGRGELRRVAVGWGESADKLEVGQERRWPCGGEGGVHSTCAWPHSVGNVSAAQPILA